MRRKAWLLTGAAVLGAVTVTGAVVVLGSTSKEATPSAEGPPVRTAKVSQRALSAIVSVPGTLTYGAGPEGEPYSVINRADGTYTELPQDGQVVSQGQVLYRVNDSPVVLLYGSTPAYRSLSAGVTGADVAELNSDLVALGYATPAALSPTSPFFGSATASALESFQAALGITQSATLDLGEAVFEPSAVRVTTVSAQQGGDTRTGETVLLGTSTTREVRTALDASQQTDVADGDKVSITLPNNQTTPGVVSSVGTVATCPSSAGPGPGSSSARLGSDTCSSTNSGSATTPRITVEVTPSDASAIGTWDQAPVQVSITTASVPSALVVPVTALLARAGGGYSVQVVGAGGTQHLVAVSLGLFDDADGLVQVTGSALAVGQEVVVPTV